ncbi:DUF3857 domain-containing protein [Flavobacterium quisquiliarum]|uniref:DUF3857 domain-containing protein n=1 Tax=Flavobacterium quisquiliarum TaxID=1834436 RepID=A0ABV8WCK9_9FLAO|nr:DUF3857 domain-containing protein [Flavobacterium quisquiliarum]MBW1658063.1 DUF3857 domain-containing protein [Flavobacterium quisquiliarum]NWK99834.1 transglutaminase [Flavobacterium collinsii]
MKLLKLINALFLLLVVSTVTAQEFKLGKVSIAELQQKVHPKDSAAVAAILYKKGTSRFIYDKDQGFIIVTDVENRIKIYKKEGYDWANQDVFYYISGGVEESVVFSDAVTYNLVDGKIEKTKLKAEGTFKENRSKYSGHKKITLPNVKEGSVIEYRYTIKSRHLNFMRDWDFQEEIPVNYSEYVTYIPEYFVYNVRQKGYISPKVKSEFIQGSFTVNEKERDLVSGKPSFSTFKQEYQEAKTTYVAENFPAMKDEVFVNNVNNYMSSLQFELAMTKFPNQPIKPYSTDWNSVVKTIYEYDDFGPELNKTGYFEEDLKALLAAAKSNEERIFMILNFVKANVSWNGIHGYACDNGVRKAYKEKTGNIADINLMLTAMLRHAGLKANPVLVSTRSNGIAFFANRTAFNYVIAAVETDQGNILLDASSKYSSPNILPLRALNWQGRLIRKDGTSEAVDLMPNTISNDNVFVNYTIDPTGKIDGKVRRQCTEYNAMVFRNNFESVKQDAYLEKLENESGKIEISDYSRTNEKELLLPTIESFSFTGSNLCDLIGDKIYINPMLFFAKTSNPFKQEVREYPIDFGYPFMDKFNITIKIPDGFTVESLPKSGALTMEDNLGVFKYHIAQNESLLQLSISHQINEAIVSNEQYDMLKEYYKGMVAKETEKIVLKRI